MSLPEPDLRDWHMSGVRIFVLDAAQLRLELTCTHTDEEGNMCSAVNYAPELAGKTKLKYIVKGWQESRVVMCVQEHFYILRKRYICGKCGVELSH